MKFAKLFDIADEQLLLFTEYDPEKDTTIIHHITDAPLARIDTKIELKKIDHETLAIKYLADFDAVQAAKMIDGMREMLEN